MTYLIVEDFKLKLRNGDPITRLIIINVVLFLICSVFRVITFLSGESDFFVMVEIFIKNNLSLSLAFGGLVLKPWTLISYMFTHFSVMHIFWNMITLYWFGQLLSDYTSPKKLIPLYLLGGIVGAVLTIVVCAIIPAFRVFLGTPIIGASASVTAIIIATATLLPTVKLNMLFIGQVKLIYVALFVISIDMLNIASYDNIGGNLSHLGGAVMGFVFSTQYKKGRDLSRGINKFFEWVIGLLKRNPVPRNKMKVAYKRGISDEEYNYNKQKEQEYVDSILDKISKSGYASLTKKEKERLFKASGK